MGFGLEWGFWGVEFIAEFESITCFDFWTHGFNLSESRDTFMNVMRQELIVKEELLLFDYFRLSVAVHDNWGVMFCEDWFLDDPLVAVGGLALDDDCFALIDYWTSTHIGSFEVRPKPLIKPGNSSTSAAIRRIQIPRVLLHV